MRGALGLSVVCAGAIAASGAIAQTVPSFPPAGASETRVDAPVPPTASVRLFSMASPSTRWTGDGDGVIVTSLCVASTTGRYRLEITSMSGGGLAGAGNLPFDIIFVDGSGARQTKRLDRGAASAVFEGVSPGQSDCDHGANARIEISASVDAIRAQMAGAYSDRLTFKADPL